jgi:hypothetical protein
MQSILKQIVLSNIIVNNSTFKQYDANYCKGYRMLYADDIETVELEIKNITKEAKEIMKKKESMQKQM